MALALTPTGTTSMPSRHLGLRLIDGFADQLNGTIEFASAGGTRARFSAWLVHRSRLGLCW